MKLAPSAPYDPAVLKYMIWYPGGDRFCATEFTDWKTETLSWKESCYIHSYLSEVCAGITIKGKDAEKLMSELCVNGFTKEKFKVGRAKHVIACSDKGYIGAHGMCLRIAEDEFLTYFLEPNIDVFAYSGRYEIEPINPDPSKDFIYQLGGPRSLEIVENAIKQDIHHLKFMEFMPAKISNCDVRILRMGMGGSIAYEVHGMMEDVERVHTEIMRVGEPYGIKKLGVNAYMCNHTENGFPQLTLHFVGDWFTDEDMLTLMETEEGAEGVGDTSGMLPELRGSLADQGIEAYYLNPVEAGWKRMINWDHEFKGKDALRRIFDSPKTRQVVTLEWDREDVLKVFDAFLDDDADVTKYMPFPQDYTETCSGNQCDKVLDDQGNLIGKSTGRIYTLYYKKVISMAFIDPEFAELGTEVSVLWGDPDQRQIPIKAIVARYPYLDLTRNEEYDIESIPHYQE